MLLLLLAFIPCRNFGQFKVDVAVEGLKVIVEHQMTQQERIKSKVTRMTPGNNPAPANQPSNVLFYSPDLFSTAFISSFFTPALRQELTSRLRALILREIGRKLPKGFGIHSQSNLQLGSNYLVESGYFQHEINPSVSIKATIPGNRLFVRITTPKGVPSGLDPDAEIFFDLEASCPIKLPTHTIENTALPRLGDIRIVATHISKPKSNNMISKLLIDYLIPAIEGPQFFNQLRQDRSFVIPTRALNDKMTEIRRSISGVPAMRIENYVDGPLLILKATNAERVSPVVK